MEYIYIYIYIYILLKYKNLVKRVSCNFLKIFFNETSKNNEPTGETFGT